MPPRDCCARFEIVAGEARSGAVETGEAADIRLLGIEADCCQHSFGQLPGLSGDRLALRHVLAGETWQPEAREGEAAPEGGLMTQRIAALTPQQRNILSLMAAGKPNKIIAYELGIAETTVKAHITLILRKLGVFSRTQAVLAARDLVS